MSDDRSLSAPARRALRILRDAGESLTASQFAAHMWPAPSATRRGVAGRAGSYLYWLCKRGLVSGRIPLTPALSRYQLTTKGRDAVADLFDK